MTYSRREMIAAAGATAAVASGSGCLGIGGQSGSATPEPPAAALGSPAEGVTVAIRSEPAPEFDPQIVHVEVGATVEWLVETGRHDVTAYHEDVRSFMHQPPDRTPEGVDAWRSDLLDGPGASYARTFDIEGVYDYVDKQEVCVSHEVAGNVGRVIVGWPDPDTQPAMDPPPGELPVRVVRALELFNERTRPVLEAGADVAADADGHGTYRPTDRQLAGSRP
ncbi:plastocyanin/azurin family copper-binding protein [Natronomonas sp.]|uniref:plastocyanin/azurin family copper-binding protein n=1 Tax=Natronomonas sp. TaxID=2184060 RepID=UPI00398A0752